MIDVTIIVPVYNVQNYISKCLDSLVNQDYDENKFEIYVIDDCSKDNSLKIVEEYASKYNNITVKKLKENKGVSHARNIGIKESKGKYLMFCDSDDFYENNTITTFMNLIQKKDADFVTANYFIDKNNQNIKVNTSRYFSKDVIEKGEIISYMTLTSCSKIIKKEIFIENNIFYPEDLKRCEELTVIPVLAYLAERPIAIEDTLYHYVQRESSASNNKQDDVSYFETSFKRFCKYIDKNKYKEEIEFRAIEHLLYGKTLVMLKGKLSNQEIKKHISDFKKEYPNALENKYLKEFSMPKRILIKSAYKEKLVIAKMFAVVHEKITG